MIMFFLVSFYYAYIKHLIMKNQLTKSVHPSRMVQVDAHADPVPRIEMWWR